MRAAPLLLRACLLLALGGGRLAAQNTTANEGGDLAFGGAGKEPGRFEVLEDITFDPKGTLYALDGVRMNNQAKHLEGNLRVEKFDRTGKLLGEIDLKTAPGVAWSEKLQPQRLAADSAGEVFVTVPALGAILQWNHAGAFVRAIELPRAMAITLVGKGPHERLAVIASRREVVPQKGWTWLGGDRIEIFTPGGVHEKTIPLPQAWEDVRDLTADPAGNFYVKAEPNAIYQVSPEGRLLHTWGGNPSTRNGDGSEVLHSVGVDSAGSVYTFAWGNPSLLTRFDADGRTVTQREGQWKWADPWGAHSAYTPLAIDPEDRVWVAATAVHEPSSANYAKYRAVPAIVRTRPDFFAPAASVHQRPLRSLGFRATVKSTLPHNVTYDPAQPVPMEFSVAAANRNVSAVTTRWRVFNALKTEVAHGSFETPLQNGVAATAAFQWTPPRYGAYFVQVAMSAPEGELGALGEHVGVTPRFPGMPELPAESGGWADAERQLWSGLPNVRLHPKFRATDQPGERAKKMEALETQIAAAEKAGLTFLVQMLESQKDFRAEDVRAVMERFKGRIKYVEVCNEPNFTGSVDEYFAVHQGVYAAVKAVDPAAQVLGPATVNIDLNWLRRLYELGFAKVSDAVSVHDYEGHESIDPVHWRWKFAEARQIMAEHGDAQKPMWQTERAISGVRGGNFQGLVQAIRMSLHRDLLETLGIPSAHNVHYYLNQGGYSAVPSYVWSAKGPLPAALALRTRHALTAALHRPYAGMLDFGPTGNTLCLGVRYAGAEGETVALRSLGAPESACAFEVTGTKTLRITDAWGNATEHPVHEGTVNLPLGQLPIYVLLGKGESLTSPKLDFGRNVAGWAEFSYSGASKSPLALLNNGITESYQGGDPHGDTNGAKIWQGDLPVAGQTLEMRFPGPQRLERVILRTPRADNQFSTLLDFDLQSWDGQAWQTLLSEHRPMPPSEPAVTADATHAIWMDDTCVFPLSFPPVTTEKLRLLVRQTTHGFVPDDGARAWSNVLPQKVMLREVELYAPATPVSLAAKLGPQGSTEVTVHNGSGQPFRGTLYATVPAGWTGQGELPISLAAGSEKTWSFPTAPPAVLESGSHRVWVELRDEKGTLQETDSPALAVAAPVELFPLPSTPAETTGEDALLKATVKNTTGAPLSGQARVRLSGPGEPPAPELPFGPLPAGESTTLTWRVPGVDLAAQRWNAAWEVTANGVRVTARRELYGQSWLATGPFPRGFDVPEGPEKTMQFDPAETFTDMMGNERRWQPIRPGAEGMVILGEIIKPSTDVMAYAVSVVTSPQARKALFSVGTDDGGKGWWNGKLVYADDATHGAAPGQKQIPVELRAGRNEVWLKVTQSTGGWGFYFDLLDPQTGRPLTDLLYGTSR